MSIQVVSCKPAGITSHVYDITYASSSLHPLYPSFVVAHTECQTRIQLEVSTLYSASRVSLLGSRYFGPKGANPNDTGRCRVDANCEQEYNVFDNGLTCI